MNRREIVKNAVKLGLLLTPGTPLTSTPVTAPAPKSGGLPTVAGPRKPLAFYNNWSAYDELSDNIPLTEELAMKELNELVRLKKNGVQIDYYVMDAFWFDQTGGYRVWHKERWPNGPDNWLNKCKENKIIPGMWFSTNDRIDNGNGGFFLDLIPEWKSSATTNPKALSLSEGGYLKHLMDTLQLWANKGVGVFKFDFARFGAASAETQRIYLPEEIEERNKKAFIDALKRFRLKNPDVLIIGYNGFGGDMSNTYMPFRKLVDLRWLEVFDTMYCGDPRFSDVPAANIWRSQDIYSDHMVRQYELNGLPIYRIDNCGYMTGVAGTCYKRKKNAWKGMLIMEHARGGWVNVYHGNMELLSDTDAQWFAKTQKLYLSLQSGGIASTFGGMPGQRQPYGFMAKTNTGALCTVVNPSQEFAALELPVRIKKSAVIYADGGFKPEITSDKVTLGPEQMAVVGIDEYADPKYNLGTDESINIPVAITPLEITTTQEGKNAIACRLRAIKSKDVRIFLQQIGGNGYPHRSSGGPPPNGKDMDTIIRIKVSQGGKPVEFLKEYNKKIWSGISWGAVIIQAEAINYQLPLDIECNSTETEELILKAEAYAVSY